MAETEKQRLEKVTKLLTLIEELRVKEAAILREMQTLVAGGVSIGQQMKQATDRWCRELWPARYGNAYTWEGVKSSQQLKRLLLQLGASDVDARMQNYIQNQDPFFVSRRHPFPLFVTTINQHANAGAVDDRELQPPVADCHHSPRCYSDQEHTRRRNQEMRGSHSGPVGDVL